MSAPIVRSILALLQSGLLKDRHMEIAFQQVIRNLILLDTSQEFVVTVVAFIATRPVRGRSMGRRIRTIGPCPGVRAIHGLACAQPHHLGRA
jgi:hypothetical protein